VLIEDSVQEIFLDLWNRRSKMAEVASINSYLFSSFRYTLIRKIKGAQKHVPEHEPDEPDFSAALALEVKEQDAEWQQRIQAALNTLTPRQREAIFLRFYEGLSYEEVARIMGISTKATYKVMARSLASLKERLAVPVATLLLVLRCMH
jgi:RNA polymerase sigma factor (sigma-70 family)